MHVTDSPNSPAAPETNFATFREVDIRIGTILEATPLDGARKPAYKLLIDFGEGIGHKKSSAQITELYQPSNLIGQQIIAVVNFPPRQIGKFMSEVLTLGFPDADGEIVLAKAETSVPNGARLV